jgi:hypothetical protein
LRSRVFAATALVALLVNVVVLRRDAYPLRWMLLGLVLMSLFAIYPILYNVYVSTTNYGFGHLLTKQQVIQQFESTMYLPEEGGAYTWTAYRSEAGRFALWLQTADGQSYLAFPGRELLAASPGEEGVGGLDGQGIPVSLEGYQRLNRLTVLRYIGDLGNWHPSARGSGGSCGEPGLRRGLEPRYVYDRQADVLTDQQTGTEYIPCARV